MGHCCSKTDKNEIAEPSQVPQNNANAGFGPVDPSQIENLSNGRNNGNRPIKRHRDRDQDPEILFDENNAHGGADKENFPEYYTENCTISGAWSYKLDSEQTEFPQEIQDQIEKAFLRGDPKTAFKLHDEDAEVVFADDNLIIHNSAETSVHHIERTPLRKEIYGWICTDKTMRPIIKEIEDMLGFTGGVFSFQLDGKPYQVNIPKQALYDMDSKRKRKIVLL
ncbi:unnamed protein product [Blepharisma stoltei]|uniref:Uncharacterized protein n=1 Tax=Blepharisma stoltei TaxID=1481888 RepID=A0AAU9JKN7_9CILI|nr:unnamed protein product [Blepharisma stoltei]